MSPPPVAIIADIIGSRSQPDRDALQQRIESILHAEGSPETAEQSFAATVGDEFQAVFPDLSAAFAATLGIQLALPEGVGLRFGLGQGAVREVSSGTSTRIQDGPGWWRAREAIEDLEAIEARHPHARSRFRGDGSVPDSLVNAYLLARDQLIGQMGVRARGYAHGALRGRTQAETAAEYEVSQSAISQSLRRSGGAALLEGLSGMEGELRG